MVTIKFCLVFSVGLVQYYIPSVNTSSLRFLPVSKYHFTDIIFVTGEKPGGYGAMLEECLVSHSELWIANFDFFSVKALTLPSNGSYSI